MATPQKQRLCEEEDPDIANLILQTPDSEKGFGTNYDTIPGSISLFEGERDGVVMRRSPGNAAGGALDDLDRFNSISSVATISSQAPPRSRTPPTYVRWVPVSPCSLMYLLSLHHVLLALHYSVDGPASGVAVELGRCVANSIAAKRVERLQEGRS